MVSLFQFLFCYLQNQPEVIFYILFLDEIKIGKLMSFQLNLETIEKFPELLILHLEGCSFATEKSMCKKVFRTCPLH